MYFRHRVPRNEIAELKRENRCITAVFLLSLSMIQNVKRVVLCHDQDFGLYDPINRLEMFLRDHNSPNFHEESLRVALECETEFIRVLHTVPSKRRTRRDYFDQRSYNEINAILYYSSASGRSLLPPALLERIKKKAKKSPDQVIDVNRELSEQNLSEKTRMFLLYFHQLIKESEKYEELHEEALSEIRSNAAVSYKKFFQGDEQ